MWEALAQHHPARPVGPVLVESMSFAPFGWKLRAPLKRGVRNLQLRSDEPVELFFEVQIPSFRPDEQEGFPLKG